MEFESWIFRNINFKSIQIDTYNGGQISKDPWICTLGSSKMKVKLKLVVFVLTCVRLCDILKSAMSTDRSLAFYFQFFYLHLSISNIQWAPKRLSPKYTQEASVIYRKKFKSHVPHWNFGRYIFRGQPFWRPLYIGNAQVQVEKLEIEC